eukprot:TRINITY_DN22542_c0_g1_i2.p1 TRINITY_DN22542_c0_g1~~TRINITY_DN22542_c0_g1_i2.p1  ORF type:complete len:682 (-),score=79.79 TRINITY_DN22542_c0_g1_i2:774-2531(-)
MTVFNPHAMAALVVVKVLLPMLFLATVFAGIRRQKKLPEGSFWIFVLVCTDLVALQFFFWVQDTGSWKEIGHSISRFAMMNFLIIILAPLAMISRAYLVPKKTRRIAPVASTSSLRRRRRTMAKSVTFFVALFALLLCAVAVFHFAVPNKIPLVTSATSPIAPPSASAHVSSILNTSTPKPEPANTNLQNSWKFATFYDNGQTGPAYERRVQALLMAAKFLKGNRPDIVSAVGPVCRWNLQGHMLVLQPFTRSIGCHFAAPPFLYNAESVRPPVITPQTPWYPQAGMSLQLFEWYLRLNHSLAVHTLENIPGIPVQKASGMGSFVLHWIAIATGFRAILEPTGDVLWIACSRTATGCRQDNPADPPTTGPVCCAHILRKQLHLLHDVGRACSRRIWVLAGSLLGAARNGRVIPWDWDNDVAFDINPSCQRVLRQTVGDTMQLTLFMRGAKGSPEYTRIFPTWPFRSRPVPRLAADIDVQLSSLVLYSNMYYKFPYTDITHRVFKTCNKVLLENRTFCAEGDIPTVLKKVYGYGSHWQTPDRSFATGLEDAKVNEQWPPLFFIEQKDRQGSTNTQKYLMKRFGSAL